MGRHFEGRQRDIRSAAHQLEINGIFAFGATGKQLVAQERDLVRQTMTAAYRLQYILSGARHPHFAAALASMTTEAQQARIHAALAALAPPQMLNAA